MKYIKNLYTLLVVALAGLSLAACGEDDYDTNQYLSEVSLNVYGPSPVMRGGTLRFIGSNLDQVAQVEIPGVAPITSIEVVKAGVPSEIRVIVPHDGPTEGFVKLVTKSGKEILTKTELRYTEGLDPAHITMTPSAMPGDKIRLTVPEDGDDYLDLIHMVELSDGVMVGEADFTAHTRYLIELVVPEDARTGKLNLYTADLTVTEVAESNVEYQIITTEQALIVGTPAVSRLASPRGNADGQGSVTAKAGETISLTGSYFNVVSQVKVGGVTVSDITVAADGKTITFALPADAPDGDVVLVCKSGVEVPAGTIVTVKPANAVAAPAPVKALQPLTVSGSDMDVVVSVEFPNADAQSGDAITVSADKVVVNAVPEKTTEGNLTLRMANGTGIEVAFTLVKPTATGYDNASVSAGGQLTINGTDLDLIKTVTFGEGSDAVSVEGAATAITLTVPMNAKSGKPTLKLANGTSIEGPELNISEALFCYITAMPEFDDETTPKAGNTLTVPVANSDKLTAVQLNGADCQYILAGDEKNQLIIGIPESASATSTLKLISSNGEIEYTISVIPATSVSKTVWAGLTQLDWGDGHRVLIPASAFEGVPAGAILTLCYSQVDQQWDQAQINYGDWSGINFNEGEVQFNQILVPTDVYGWFSDGILNRETPLVLTQEILDNIQAKKGDCEDQTNCGIIIQGSGLTFSKVTLSYEISLEQDLSKCIVRQDDQSVLMPFPIQMSWDDNGRFRVLIDADPAIKDMRLVAGKSTMYFYATGTGQLQINDANWSSFTTLADWDNPDAKVMELVLTDDIIAWLKGTNSDGWSSTALIIQGDGLTLTKVTILP